MKIAEILTVTLDNCNVMLLNEKNGQLLAKYDGKDSIDEKYNNYDVFGFAYSKDALIIYVWED